MNDRSFIFSSLVVIVCLGVVLACRSRALRRQRPESALQRRQVRTGVSIGDFKKDQLSIKNSATSVNTVHAQRFDDLPGSFVDQ
jgi:hypothetical protein